MADNRQFTDHNEIGGVNVYLEDKKLGELKDATAVTSMSNTQFIPLQDSTDGSLEKIGLSDFKSVMFKGSTTVWLDNIDDAKNAGVYFLNGTSSSEALTDDAILVVYFAKRDNNEICTQIRFPKNFPVVIFRTYSGNAGRWTEWVTLG